MQITAEVHYLLYDQLAASNYYIQLKALILTSENQPLDSFSQ